MHRTGCLTALIALAVALPAPLAFAQTSVPIILAQDDAGTVIGQPLYAVQRTTEVQTLPDGTHLTRQTEERKWRDSQGRYRRESAVLIDGQQPAFHTAFIIDPVASTVTVLNLDRKTAVVTHLPATGPYALHPYVDLDQKPIAALSGVDIKVEKLDGRTITGVYAVGRRVTRTRPPGAIGNDRPVVTVAERWVSPDLKLLLASSSNDPRLVQTRQVTQLERSEPDPGLFQVPADFASHAAALPVRRGCVPCSADTASAAPSN